VGGRTESPLRREAWDAARRGPGLAWFARGLTAGRLSLVQAQRREAWDAARRRLGPAWFARGLTAGRLSHAVHSSTRITCEPYSIFDNEPAGRNFAEALGRTVARGVDVRVLIDGIGSSYTFPSITRALTPRGVKAARLVDSPVDGTSGAGFRSMDYTVHTCCTRVYQARGCLFS